MKYVMALEKAFSGINFCEVFDSRKTAEARLQLLCDESKNIKKITPKGDKYLIQYTNKAARVIFSIYETSKAEYYVRTTNNPNIGENDLWDAVATNQMFDGTFFPFTDKRSAEKFIRTFIEDNKKSKSTIEHKYGAFYFQKKNGEWDCCSCGIASENGGRFYESDLSNALKIYEKELFSKHMTKMVNEPRNVNCSIIIHLIILGVVLLLAFFIKGGAILWIIISSLTILSLLFWLCSSIKAYLNCDYFIYGDKLGCEKIDSFEYVHEYTYLDGTVSKTKMSIVPALQSFSEDAGFPLDGISKGAKRVKFWKNPSEYKKH